jgi:hypothetical protein
LRLGISRCDYSRTIDLVIAGSNYPLGDVTFPS